MGSDCCLTQGTADLCASTCPGTSVDIACNGANNCPQNLDAGPLVCCADGTLDTTTCSYPMFTTLQRTRCLPSCTAIETTICGSNTECAPPLKCVGTTIKTAQGYTVAICQ
jgi:hypothetical protein